MNTLLTLDWETDHLDHDRHHHRLAKTHCRPLSNCCRIADHCDAPCLFSGASGLGWAGRATVLPVQFRQAHGAGRPARTRRAADRRPRQDRISGRVEAAALRRASDRHDAFPARLGDALRQRAGLRRVERPTGDLRSRSSAYAERRGVLPRDAGHPRSRLDFIINNACQTVRRPPAFYAHMMAGEQAARDGHARGRAAAAGQLRRAARLSHAAGGERSPRSRRWCAETGQRRRADARGRAVAGAAAAGGDSPDGAKRPPMLVPAGRLDQDLQQVDLRDRNSWRLLLDEVPSVELLEVQLVNAVAPFIINARLKPLMLRTPGPRQAHRQCVGGGRTVLPEVQDHAASAHQHGQGGAEHDDAHVGGRLLPSTAFT